MWHALRELTPGIPSTSPTALFLIIKSLTSHLDREEGAVVSSQCVATSSLDPKNRMNVINYMITRNEQKKAVPFCVCVCHNHILFMMSRQFY